MKKPIFILGAPRSGTTFLASLLERTDYGAPFETHFITKYFKKLDSYGDLNNLTNFKNLLDDILSERAVAQWDLQLDVQEFYDELSGDFRFSNIADQLCLKASRKKGFEQWGDKTPNYLGDLDILFQLYPESKFLYIVRDGRDVALSLLEKTWGPNNVYYCAEYWKFLNRDHAHLDELKQNKQLYFLKYEDLLDNVEHYIADIYRFLEMDFSDEDVLVLSKTVKKGNYNKWKTLMSKTQIKTFESLAANTLVKFGYETSHEESSVPIFMRLGYVIQHLFYRAKHLFIVNVIDTIKIKFFGKQPFAE